MDIVQRIAMKAAIVNNGKILILREAGTYEEGTQAGRWHLPGGRIEAGEGFQDALKREVFEETCLTVEILYPIFTGEWWPTIKGVKNQIIATYQVCNSTSSDVRLSEEHNKYEWIEPEDYKNYDLMDPVPEVIQRYQEWQKNSKPR